MPRPGRSRRGLLDADRACRRCDPVRPEHLLSRAEWEAALFRDDLRGFDVGQLHDEEAVLVLDETGDLKKEVATVGVQRQYTTPPSQASEASAAGSPPGRRTRGRRRERRVRHRR
ncbi:transposase [Streptomyces mirabilis]|uniref:transposase n=1 Tax=Streptomyces mirabilis TaxID=68239 RepID=UPI0033B529DF